MIDPHTLLRANVVEAAQALCKTITLEDAEMLSTYVRHGATIGHYDLEELKRWEDFQVKLIDLAQAVQDYEE